MRSYRCSGWKTMYSRLEFGVSPFSARFLGSQYEDPQEAIPNASRGRRMVQCVPAQSEEHVHRVSSRNSKTSHSPSCLDIKFTQKRRKYTKSKLLGVTNLKLTPSHKRANLQAVIGSYTLKLCTNVRCLITQVSIDEVLSLDSSIVFRGSVESQTGF